MRMERLNRLYYTSVCYLLGEAQKKLDELQDQKSRYDSEVNELRDKCTEKQKEIDDINQQLAQQDRMEQVRFNITS